MNVKVSVFVICDEAIVYLLLYNLHDCTFKNFISLFSKVASLKATLLKRDVNRCFPVKIAKFLRTPFLTALVAASEV